MLLSRGAGAWAVMAAIFLNCAVHEFGRRRSERDYDTVNYVINMIFAVRKLRRLHDGELDAQLQEAYASLDRLRAVIRTGGVSRGMDNGSMEDLLLTVTLLDLITYEYLKNKLGRCHDDVFTIHEQLGRLDAAISVASYRASLGQYAEPVLRFERGSTNAICAKALFHPLLSDPVPNDCVTERSILITGSNASGKSTYLKTAALSAILAQSICTAPAESYESRAFRIYSSMALRDDLMAGESYYIAETKSLKRILDALKEDSAVLCVVDEVLRGTNTVERISAGAEVLRGFSENGILCFAATHDIELAHMLPPLYTNYHFDEEIKEDDITFPYQLKDGYATTRNAIALLKIMGYPAEITDKAIEIMNRENR